MMHKIFQMSSIGELTFFLGLKVKQKDDGIFISQDRYMADILKKFDFVTMKTSSTPIETNKALIKDEEAKDVDAYLYRSMIGSLMYLTASRPNIMFAICTCARFEVTPKVLHLYAIDYAGVSLDKKSTIGGCQFLRRRLISRQCKKHLVAVDRDSYEKRLIQVIKIHTDHNVADLLTKAFDVSRFQYLIATKNEIQVSAVRVTYYWKAKRTTEISQSSGPILLVSDETVIKEWEDIMERATTTASSLEAEQDSGNINRTQSMATLNESLSQETSLGSGPRC
ncbi:uncharacterized mitochondrial protein-like protein [Tanacetum coccineum]